MTRNGLNRIASKMVFALVTGAMVAAYAPNALAQTFPDPSRSTSIVMTSDDRWVIVANRESDSVSIIQVRDEGGQDDNTKLAEIGVGDEPRYVAIRPDDSVAFVSNSASGTVSVIALSGPSAFQVVLTIPVGTEPRGIAITPNGSRVYVANHTDGTVSVIDTSGQVIATRELGGNPSAIAITNDGDQEDTDERVFVTQFYAELIPGGPGEGFDDGKQAIVHTFQVGGTDSAQRITLGPLPDAGFTADRTAFCPQSNDNLHSDIFCPDVDADPTSSTITADPQGAYPNQLQAAVIRGNFLYVPNIGAGPEPPVRFNVNVQALVPAVDTVGLSENVGFRVNLNRQVAQETQPSDPAQSLDRLFGNDLVAIDATQSGTSLVDDTFLIVSRGGNFVFRANPSLEGLQLGNPVVRYQTGNIPSGVVINNDGTRAYTNNEVGFSITAINLETDQVIERDIPSSTPPEPGTFEHFVLAGKLAFHTALGMPDNGVFDLPIRDIVPLDDRGKASDNAWSSCASCHPDGLADGVTWYFPTGPRQSVQLDAFFAKDNPADQRISNWSAVRGSITDFNNNSRNIQGGIGFAGDPPSPNIHNHGITQGASDALDVMTLWVQTVRAPILPEPTDMAAYDAGRAVFENWCASCHGGAKWTKSQIFHADNPAFNANPLGDPPGTPRDPGVTNAGPQIVSYESEGQTIAFLEDIGTFNGADPREIRGAGAAGTTAVGGLGFNVPSLLGTAYHAPYFHNGAAQTLEEVFPLHALDGGTIESTLSQSARENLLVFLNGIDGSTNHLRSEGDDFRDSLGPL
ncbi:beta-propeller fold lactonase family protein [Candidatus Entotheonella palauensis]|uniref:beta-propeller fold lactonase family protein n=1 Tax=Candidatus Entotheonella palauensis TaxID=93172 RepID=UPI0015C438BE|nr:beta-propeller fold lactonase family protein [Candidatus Entotheonella palauensis]